MFLLFPRLDHWATIVGMLVAYNYPYLEKFLQYLDTDNEKTVKYRKVLRYGITVVLIAVFAIWFHFVLLMDRQKYIKYHPYTAPIPILIYIWLRNMHPFLRTHHLNLFTWLGKITLETYLSQIHIYMIGDAKKILVYLPNYPLLNFFLATIIYLFVSYHLFHLTVFFSSYILPRDLKVIGKNALYGFVWLGTCYFFAFSMTKKNIWSVKETGLEFLLWKIKKD